MNKLGREIQKGEIVVIDFVEFWGKPAKLYDRLFVAHAGFGMSHLTSGSAIGGNLLKEPSKSIRIEGWMLDRRQTEEFQQYLGDLAPLDYSGIEGLPAEALPLGIQADLVVCRSIIHARNRK